MRKHTINLTEHMYKKRFYESPKWWSVPKNIILSLTGGILLLSLVIVSLIHSKSYLLNRVYTLQTEKQNMEQQLYSVVDAQEYDVVSLAHIVNDSLSTAYGKNKEFLKTAIPQAIRIQQRYNIPASAVLGQAIYESGYGQSGLARRANNFFGIKALDKTWDGGIVWMTTKDFNQTVIHKQPFRRYETVYDGFSGYVNFLKNNRRYKNAFAYSDGKTFVSAVAAAGYCPDKNYSSQVAKIIDRHKLDRLDAFLKKHKEQKIMLAKIKE